MAYVSVNRIAGKSLTDRFSGLLDSAATYFQQGLARLQIQSGQNCINLVDGFEIPANDL